MSAEQIRADVGQLLWVGFEGTGLEGPIADELACGDVGAVVLFARNIAKNDAGAAELAAIRALNEQIHEISPENCPALIAVDQEGGLVQRVREPATRWPAMLKLDGQPDPAATARELGLAMGRELRALGFDLDFAPVLDVHTNEANPIIGNRAFGTTADAVCERALAFAQGMMAADMLSCGKHFPGHGDTDTDSHLALPRLNHSMDRLREVELLPFLRAAQAGVPLMMTAHVVFGALDSDFPATLSPEVISRLLREEMGYEGVIVSDDLDMKAIADHYGVGEAAVMAVRAGCDSLLLCRDREHQNQAREALIAACGEDEAFRETVARASERIRALKRGLPQDRPGLEVVGCREHQELAARLSANH